MFVIKKLLPLALGGAAGAALGFIYWYYVGCMSGTCPITSSPMSSTIYGSVLGMLIVNLYSKQGNETPQ